VVTHSEARDNSPDRGGTARRVRVLVERGHNSRVDFDSASVHARADAGVSAPSSATTMLPAGASVARENGIR
jgi:hypothetical protein